MKNQLSNYDDHLIDQFEQALSESETLWFQAQELKNRFFILFVSFIFLIAWAVFSFLYLGKINQQPFWYALFLFFSVLLYHLRNAYKSYLREKKTFSQNYKHYLIPRMLKIIGIDYYYTPKPAYDDQHQSIANEKEYRNINQDVEKIIESWLWEGENKNSNAALLIAQLFAFFNIFGIILLIFKSRFRKKVNFEDFFSSENEKAKFKAVEIQNYPLVLHQNTSGSKFLSKFSYSNAKFLMHNDLSFFIKLSSLKTKIRNIQLKGKRMWCYLFLIFTTVIPLFIFAFLDRRYRWETKNAMIFLVFGIIFLVMYTMFVFDLDPRKFKKAEFQNPLADAVRGSVLFSQDFLEYYDIQTNDQVYANDFLNPSLKEKLMLLHQHYRGTYDFYFEGKDFYCIKHLPKGRHFLDSFSHRNRRNKKTLTKLYAEIKELNLLFSLLER